MKKRIIALALILALLFAAALLFNARRGVSLGEHFLRRKSGSVFEESARWRIALSRGADGTAFDIRAGEEALRATLTWQDAYARVAFDDGETIEGAWRAADATLIGADGVPLAWMDGIFISVNGESLPVSRAALANALCRIDTDHTEARGSLLLPFAGAALYALGAAAFLWPEAVYFLGMRWRYETAELSDAGRLAEQTGGVAAMLAAALMMFAPAFL